jgi:hypothetical protein
VTLRVQKEFVIAAPGIGLAAVKAAEDALNAGQLAKRRIFCRTLCLLPFGLALFSA